MSKLAGVAYKLVVSFHRLQIALLIALSAVIAPAFEPRREWVPFRAGSSDGQLISSTPLTTPEISLGKAPLCFRWSSRGGCYNEADFFFELRERKDGSAEWRGLRCQFGSLMARLIAANESEIPKQGNYQASGTLSPDEFQRFVRSLQDAGIWDLGPELSSTGPRQSVHFRVGERVHEVPGYQSSCEDKTTTEDRVNNAAWQGLPGEVCESLYRRVESDAPPDRPLLVPGQQVDTETLRARTATKEELSLGLEVIPMKNLWPGDRASLFLIPW